MIDLIFWFSNIIAEGYTNISDSFPIFKHFIEFITSYHAINKQTFSSDIIVFTVSFQNHFQKVIPPNINIFSERVQSAGRICKENIMIIL